MHVSQYVFYEPSHLNNQNTAMQIAACCNELLNAFDVYNGPRSPFEALHLISSPNSLVEGFYILTSTGGAKIKYFVYPFNILNTFINILYTFSIFGAIFNISCDQVMK